MAPSQKVVIRTMINRVKDGEDIPKSLQYLATHTIPIDISTQMDLEKTLAPLSGSPHLNGYIHEILKKLDGQKSKNQKIEDQKSVFKKRNSIKKVSKIVFGSKRRSSGVTKKILENSEENSEDVVHGNSEDVKENSRMFQKKEPKVKKSKMWKKAQKTQN
ncbi:unnamed protein product [Caenorhabditis nigoni]